MSISTIEPQSGSWTEDLKIIARSLIPFLKNRSLEKDKQILKEIAEEHLRSIQELDEALHKLGDNNPWHNPMRCTDALILGFPQKLVHLAQVCKYNHSCVDCKTPCPSSKLPSLPDNFHIARYVGIHDKERLKEYYWRYNEPN